jgi:hypothetical protein
MDVDPKLDEVLERRGFEVVLGLLQTSAGGSVQRMGGSCRVG